MCTKFGTVVGVANVIIFNWQIFWRLEHAHYYGIKTDKKADIDNETECV